MEWDSKPQSLSCGALRDLVPCEQFFKREKHPWRSVTFSKVATLLKVTLLHGCFSRLKNCSHGTKSRKAPQLRDCGFESHSIYFKFQEIYLQAVSSLRFRQPQKENLI